MKESEEKPLPFFDKRRRTKRAVRVLGFASLLLGLLTLATGEFSMGRYRSIATGTTAVFIGVLLTSAGVVYVAALLWTRNDSPLVDDQDRDD